MNELQIDATCPHKCIIRQNGPKFLKSYTNRNNCSIMATGKAYFGKRGAFFGLQKGPGALVSCTSKNLTCVFF